MFSKTSTFKNAGQPAEKEADKAKPFFTSRQSPSTPFFSATPASVQPKLTINAPGDKYEQEADEMAERVVQAQSIQRQTIPGEEEELMQAKPLEAATVQRKCAACEPEATLQRQSEPEEEELMQTKRQETATVQRQCAACGPEATLQRQSEPEEEELMQAKPLMRASENGTATATPQLASQLNSSKGGGQPLPKDTLSSMNNIFGTDFSGVRVHTGSGAQEMSQGIQAKAFTHGSDIYFNKGQYNPGSTEGKRLLGHELTHVVQQGNIEQNVGSYKDINRNQISISASPKNFISRLPSPVDCHTFRQGLAYMKPIVKEGYDGETYTAIKSGWEVNSWKRRWQIYDANDELVYESHYTWPSPTLYIPKDVVKKGQAGGKDKPWSVWIKVTHTLVPFGGSDPDNFPHSYMKFNVYETWDDFMADPHAKLSDVDQNEIEQGKESESRPLDSSIVEGARSIVDYGSTVAMHEAYLREIYDSSAKGITNTAKKLVEKGLPQRDAAKWAIEARNQLKAKIRSDGNPILKKVFETRNLNKYGNKLGPNYQQLYRKYSKQGLKPSEINKKIIGSSGNANVRFNKWSGRLRVAGRIMIAIDIVLAGVKVYIAPEGERTQVALEELARIGGAIAMGAAGAKAGTAAGAAIGALFGGVGAAPGAIIGGIIGGIGGAIFGGWLAKSIVQQVYEMFPPSECVFEGDFVQDEQPV